MKNKGTLKNVNENFKRKYICRKLENNLCTKRKQLSF